MTAQELWDELNKLSDSVFAKPRTPSISDKLVADIMKEQAKMAIDGKFGDGSTKTFGEWKQLLAYGFPGVDEKFEPFPKVPRLLRSVTVTEKIDGTNVAVRVYADGTVRAASKTRWITPDDDHFGFAAWVHRKRYDLRKLGEGLHRGEWWGQGIGRGYGLDHRRFSLFNTARWNADTPPPTCCYVVPLIYKDLSFDNLPVVLENLFPAGRSYAAPGFNRPEGVMIYHSAAGHYFKYTLNGDGHKGAKR